MRIFLLILVITAVFGNKAQDKRKAARKAQRKAFRRNSEIIKQMRNCLQKFCLILEFLKRM